ncbi:disease resistance protein [Tanacetum coccineum]
MHCLAFRHEIAVYKLPLIHIFFDDIKLPTVKVFTADSGEMQWLASTGEDCRFSKDVVEEGYEYTGEKCKMHDLAKSEMGKDCAVIGPGKDLITSDEVLHLSLECEDFEFSKQDLKKLRSLRSMLVFNEDYKSSIRQISSHVYLRVLHMNRIESSTLPESICKLIHLRYLKISGSQIEVLQESIINLQNLQVLILEDCYNLCELPKGLRYMRNLQRLDTGRY